MSAPRYVVLEDDPTGVQLLQGVTLVTDDEEEALIAAGRGRARGARRSPTRARWRRPTPRT